MGLFDTFLKAAGDYISSDDGDEMSDTFRGFFSDEGDGGAGDGGGGFGGFVSSFLGEAEGGEGEGGGGFGGFVNSFLGDSEEGEGGGGGWGGTFGRIVDRLSGDGGRQDVWDRALGTVVDRVSQYLPEEVRNVAGQYFGQGQGQGQGQGGQGSSWSGSLVDQSQTQVPSGWHAVANHPTIGHSYGEGGFGGFLDHSIANLAGNHGMHPDYMISPQSPQMGNGGPNAGAPYDDGIRYIRAPDIEPGRPLGNDGSADPRVTTPADALRGARYVDTDGDGYADRIYPAPGADANGDGYPDRPLLRPGAADGDDDFLDGLRRLPRPDDGEQYGADTGPGGILGRSAADSDSDYGLDGDGHLGGTDPIGGANVDRGGILRSTGNDDGYDDRADYDDLVTSGAPASPPEPRYQAPDDPTFPADDPGAAAVSGPAAMPAEPPAVEPPPSDFQQSIDDANQVDQSMDTMFDGLEGSA